MLVFEGKNKVLFYYYLIISVYDFIKKLNLNKSLIQ